MSFGDKLGDLRHQAQQAVVDHKDQIQNAIQKVGNFANEKTHGKYADTIAKMGETVNAAVDKLGSAFGKMGGTSTGAKDSADASASEADGAAASGFTEGDDGGAPTTVSDAPDAGVEVPPSDPPSGPDHPNGELS